jgi:hypothetical protein
MLSSAWRQARWPAVGERKLPVIRTSPFSDIGNFSGTFATKSETV